MDLNLPILHHLENSRNILIAGAGGGFDVFSGLPLYFTLRDQGKTVHLANFSFTEFSVLHMITEPEVLVANRVVGARGPVKIPFPYYPEGYLSRWFAETLNQDVTVWMFPRLGVVPLIEAYTRLVEHLKIDALILVDGGVDSIMRGDEIGAGTLVEDTISLAAADALDLPVKILACLGFGTEVEESVCHHHALENMAALAKDGAFLGGCALTPQMPAFQQFEAACRYVWEQPGHYKSHISTRIIPAVHGEFGDFHLYPDDQGTWLLVSPLMSLYWFFEVGGVVRRSLIVDALRQTHSTTQAMLITGQSRSNLKMRPRREIPY
ncbi:MAG: DUF1152 domain-containing protein [Anaerolineae bacterium]|nr:DUF1152 domain-containing protein [Anaerolineae bacterium]